jgi:hypothetical protein
MAAITNLSIAARQAALDAVTARINAGGAGTINFYSGAMPASPDAAITSQVLLVTLAYSATAYGPTNSSGVATANAIAAGNPVASGTAAWARVLSGAGTPVIDRNVGTSAADINLGSTTIATGVPVSLTSDTLTHP